MRNVEQSMEINKAFNINDDKTFYLSERDIKRVDYSTIANVEEIEMRLRMIVTKTEVR